jgi:hypothetical protein
MAWRWATVASISLPASAHDSTPVMSTEIRRAGPVTCRVSSGVGVLGICASTISAVMSPGSRTDPTAAVCVWVSSSSAFGDSHQAGCADRVIIGSGSLQQHVGPNRPAYTHTIPTLSVAFVVLALGASEAATR